MIEKNNKFTKYPNLSVKLQSRLVKNQRIALTITTIVVWSSLAGFYFYTIDKPLVSTSYYHANIQFRAGNEESYDAIFINSLGNIVDMYYAHPTWKWTLECQGLLVEMAYENYTSIFYKMQEMNQRGQMELICPQYSHALVLAYTYNDFAKSIAYTKQLVEGIYNFTISNVVVLQEGQWLPAFPLLKNLGIDTFICSRDQLSYHNYYPKQPILTWNYGEIDAYVMPVPWLPLFEGGVFHHQLVLSDSERVNTGSVETEVEFEFNPEKQKQLELRHIELEKQGNVWMTMSEWVQYCLENENTEPMTKFMPESHWTPSRHQSVTRWMAKAENSGNDDGISLSRNWYTKTHVESAQVLFDNYRSTLNETEIALCEEKLLEAKKHLWMAQVTDTSGVNPKDYEFVYLIDNTYLAQQYTVQVIDIIRNKNVNLQNPIQIDAYSQSIITDLSRFQNVTQLDSGMNETTLEQKYGFDLSIEYSHNEIHPYDISVANFSIETYINNTRFEFEFEKLRLEFTGPYNYSINNTQPNIPDFEGSINYTACNSERSSQYMTFTDNWENIAYTPALADNDSVILHRSDYTNPAFEDDDWYIVPLAIPNGYIYNEAGNYAIITNNSVCHICVVWESDHLEYFQSNTQYNSNYEYIFFKGDRSQAQLLATLINTYPTLELI